MNVTPKGPVSLRLKEGNPITDRISADETVEALTQRIRDNEEKAMSAQDALYATLDVAIKEGIWREVQDTSISIEERYDALNRRFFADSKKVSVPVEGDKGTKRRVYERDTNWSKLSFSREEFLQMHANFGSALTYNTLNSFLDKTQVDFRLDDVNVLDEVPVNAIDNPLLEEIMSEFKDKILECYDERLNEIREILLSPEGLRTFNLETIKEELELGSRRFFGDRAGRWAHAEKMLIEFDLFHYRKLGNNVMEYYSEGATEKPNWNVKSDVVGLWQNFLHCRFSTRDSEVELATNEDLFLAATGLDKKTWENALDRTTFCRNDYARIPDRIVRDAKRVAGKIQKKLGM
tara:strand:- start:4798 stop:5844 length:1047 start_codon:yes stop_codon:yes gene_type:complete